MTFSNGIYPFYPRQRTPFIFNLNLLIVILVFSVFAFTVLLITPGIRGKLRLFWIFRMILSIFVGAVIVAVNFSNSWAAGSIKTNTSYKSFSSAVVNAEVGLQVGLSGINITLRGEPVHQLNETIDYNERFQWTDILDVDYSKALERGLPNPILYIAEKFTMNSPCGLHYQYRYSGRYAAATLWTAFCCWLAANILFFMPVIFYAGCMTVATGVFVFFSLASFSTIGNLQQCTFSLGAEKIEISFGSSFWLALCIGVMCTLLGLVVIVLDSLFPERIKGAFMASADDEDGDGLGEHYVNPQVSQSSVTESIFWLEDGRVQSARKQNNA